MVAASIVTYNTPADELQKCLSMLAACPQITRVDIIDNSRQKYIADIVNTHNSTPEAPTTQQVNYIPNDNTGYGAANNISLRQSLSQPSLKYHLVLNSDIEFSPSVITQLLTLMEQDPSIALTIPKVTDTNGIEQSHYHPLPTPFDLIAHRFLPRRWVRRRMDRYEIKIDGLTQPLNLPYVHGCFMLMRCDALRKIGLFDERFFMYPEDIDLTRRLHQHYLTLAVPHVSIIHAHRAASRRSLKMLRIHITNMIRYFNKWGWL